MYLRFVVLRPDPDSHQPQGIFQAAFELRDSGKLHPHEQQWIERELGWFREHLHAPKCLERPGTERAICWFRPEAARPIERVRSLALLLQEHGYHVKMLASRDPGTIIYRDGFQVVAFPRRPNKVPGRAARLRSRAKQRFR
jgi:hypothetical protein